MTKPCPGGDTGRIYDIAFVILTWNSEKYIADCLKSLQSFSKLSVCVCVVDNGSTDGTRRILQSYSGVPSLNMQVVLLDDNYGTTISRNKGIRLLRDKAEYLCILDSDTIVNEAAFLQMIATLRQDERNGIVGPVLQSLDGSIQQSGRNLPTLTVKLLKGMPIKFLQEKGERLEKIAISPDRATKVGYLMSACWLLPMGVVRDLGYLDEEIFYAPEDVEYCLRAWSKGYRALLEPKAAIVHAWQRLSKRKLFSRHNYEHIKGLCYLFRKYGYCFSPKKFERLMNA